MNSQNTPASTAHSASPAKTVVRNILVFLFIAGLVILDTQLPKTGASSRPPWALWTHLITALIAVPLGAYVLYRPKGTPTHKLLGRIWAACMLITASASFALQHQGRFGLIHVFSIWTFISLTGALYSIRRGNVKAHAKFMKGLYFGLLIAGSLAVMLPGRLLSTALFG